MDKGTQERFRIILEEETTELKRNLAQSVDASAIVELDSSIGRLSRMDAMQSQQMALELRRRQEAQLIRVEKALERVTLGTFGTCIKCKNDIATERLDVQPAAPLCVTCAASLTKR